MLKKLSRKVSNLFRRSAVSRFARPLRAVSAVGTLWLGFAATASAQVGGGMLSGLANKIASTGQTWAPALAVLGALICGGKAMMGSRETGHNVTNWLIGAIFLTLAALGMGIMSAVQNMVGSVQ